MADQRVPQDHAASCSKKRLDSPRGRKVPLTNTYGNPSLGLYHHSIRCMDGWMGGWVGETLQRLAYELFGIRFVSSRLRPLESLLEIVGSKSSNENVR